MLAVPVRAGDFTLDWHGVHDWPAESTGPETLTMTDQYGFELDARLTITRIGGTAFPGTPNDLFLFAGNTFGTQYSLWLVWDADPGRSGIGESTNTVTLELMSGGSPIAADALSFIISDIESVGSGDQGDRCDFVTVTGNNGNPALSYVSPFAPSRSVIIGPGSGSGQTGSIGANQAQCVRNTGDQDSPVSDGDDYGSIRATFPVGTSVATIQYDESIENVYDSRNRDAAARGIGVLADTAVTVNQSINLTKSADVSYYTSAGETITFTYTITNEGPLPLIPGQDIAIRDGLVGNFTCGKISSAIPTGGTHSCTVTYTVTADDMNADRIASNAIAGVGTRLQSFASRLQSETARAVVQRATPSLTVTSATDVASVSQAGDVVNHTITLTNSGTLPITGLSVRDPVLTGLSCTPGRGANPGDLAPGDVTTCTGLYIATQADFDTNGGGDGVIRSSATVTGRAAGGRDVISETSEVSIAVELNPALGVTKTADDTTDVVVGQVITYTYVVTNTGNQTITNVFLSEAHNGSNAAPSPSDEILTNDMAPFGDSADAGTDGAWDVLAPGDSVTFTATYSVTQTDVETRQ